MKIRNHIFIVVSCILWLFSFSGCDIIYSLLHKPGAEEREILGNVTYNEYNVNVEELQKALLLFGYTLPYPDGMFGAATREAVARFQEEEGLEITRFVDEATWTRIELYRFSSIFDQDKINVKGVQQVLLAAGSGPVTQDGKLGPQTLKALKAFQASQQLSPDGIIGSNTLRALLKAAIKTQE